MRVHPRTHTRHATTFLLQVILKDEAIEEGFSVEEVASWTDGYSGSDLKNLCIAAAYFPIRRGSWLWGFLGLGFRSEAGWRCECAWRWE